ncbi:Nicalin [Strongyloides ratti]|uniref:BOS complex subunit NCLN n=1 Tax=Strongyloides ratti TaxID=34506 RepID=A0A090MYD1_STRRB|nr:Nicalin [Strongyloides ratti]CEF66974.1 Nicalin [Strongyloides ratti]
MLDDFFDIMRDFISIICLLILFKPTFILPIQVLNNPQEYEITAYRLQQYDIGSYSTGSKSWKFQFDAILNIENLSQKCGVILWKDFMKTNFKNIISQSNGALLIIIPQNIDKLSSDDKKLMEKFENFFRNVYTNLAIFFVEDSKNVQRFINKMQEVTIIDNSYLAQLVNLIFNNVYQLSTLNNLPNNLAKDFQMKNILGVLSSGNELNPIILFVAYYDSHSIIPGLSVSANSNGSGVATLLELLVILSKFYEYNKTTPQYNMMFALTGGGKYNYQGTRQLVDYLYEKKNEKNIELVICLDSLAKKNSINVHLSKNPSDKSATFRFVQNLKLFSNGADVKTVSKKINLNQYKLAWEHEVYNIRKIPAITLSNIDTHDSPERDSLFDTHSSLSIGILLNNIKIISETVISYVFNIPYESCKKSRSECSVLNSSIISKEGVSTFLDIVNSHSRAPPQPLDDLISQLQTIVEKYSKQDALISQFIPVDVNLYSVLEDKITIYCTKSIAFDIVLAVIISLYLFTLKYLVKNLQKSLINTFPYFSERR